ncbi:hypothetical protein ACLOJK_007474 [Asimina triloba]
MLSPGGRTLELGLVGFQVRLVVRDAGGWIVAGCIAAQRLQIWGSPDEGDVWPMDDGSGFCYQPLLRSDGWCEMRGRRLLDGGLDAADLGLDVTWVTDEGFHHRFATGGCRPDEERNCLLVRLKPLIWCSRLVLATAVANRVRRSDLNLE